MSLLLLTPPKGIPRNGLIAWHDLYDPAVALASVPDLSGKGNNLQLGSTAGADTNDPTWVADGLGLSFVTDDYCKATIPTLTDHTAIVISNVTPGASDKRIMSSGAAPLLVSGIGTSIAKKTDGKIYSLHEGVAWGAGTGLTPDGTSYYTLALVRQGTTTTLYRLDTGAVISTQTGAVTMGTNLYVGLGVNGATNYYFDGTILSDLFYNRAVTTSELQRAYRTLKATWASRGVTIL